MSFKKTTFIFMVLLLIMLHGCVNSLTAQSKDLKPIRAEVNLSIGKLLNDPDIADEVDIACMINMGIGRIFEFEANLLFWPSGFADLVISGNFSLNIPINQRVIPFATIGLGTCTHGDPWGNLGCGVKIRFTEKLGVRTEYHGWGCYDFNGDYILVGTSYYF